MCSVHRENVVVGEGAGGYPAVNRGRPDDAGACILWRVVDDEVLKFLVQTFKLSLIYVPDVRPSSESDAASRGRFQGVSADGQAVCFVQAHSGFVIFSFLLGGR